MGGLIIMRSVLIVFICAAFLAGTAPTQAQEQTVSPQRALTGEAGTAAGAAAGRSGNRRGRALLRGMILTTGVVAAGLGIAVLVGTADENSASGAVSTTTGTSTN